MRIAVLSDIHFPEHHVQAWMFTLSILPYLNLDGVILLGDIMENAPFSKFDLPPQKRLALAHELKITRKELERLRESVGESVWIDYVSGNHEAHITRFLHQHAHQLVGIKGVSIPEWLGLDDLDIRWHDHTKSHKKIGKLFFLHGDEVKVGSQYPARNLYLKVSGNLIAGHFHKFDSYYHRFADGDVHGAFINGTLRTLSPDWHRFSQWLLGWSLVSFSKGGFFHVDQIQYFKRGSHLWTTVEGREFWSR